MTDERRAPKSTQWNHLPKEECCQTPPFLHDPLPGEISKTELARRAGSSSFLASHRWLMRAEEETRAGGNAASRQVDGRGKHARMRALLFGEGGAVRIGGWMDLGEGFSIKSVL